MFPSSTFSAFNKMSPILLSMMQQYNNAFECSL